MNIITNLKKVLVLIAGRFVNGLINSFGFLVLIPLKQLSEACLDKETFLSLVSNLILFCFNSTKFPFKFENN